MPTKRPGGVRRLIFTGNVKTNLFNVYTPGSGVGGVNTFSRNALLRRATLQQGNIDDVSATRKPGCGGC